MDAALTVALAKHFGKNAPTLEPGKHAIDATITLHVRGVVAKSADTEYTPTADIPLVATLALVLEKAGFMREHSKTLLIEAMAEAAAAGGKAEGPVAERVRDIEAAMEHVRAVTGKLPKKTRSGKTTVRVEVEELETAWAV